MNDSSVEGQTLHKHKRRKTVRRLIIALLILLGLENVPGTYTLKDAQDEMDLDSWEGIALMALTSLDVHAELFFEGQTLHRISRNAEIIVPAGTTLLARAASQPFIENDEVVLRPETALLTADKPLTFIYRGVTVARAKTLRMKMGDPEHRVEAVGRYRVISALLTSYRYHRQKEVRRDYKEPTKATVHITAGIKADHEISLPEEIQVVTGAEPGTLTLQKGTYAYGNWTGGTVDLFTSLANPEPWLNPMLSGPIPNRFELGNLFELQLNKLHTIRFVDNGLDLHVNGRLTSANSNRVENVVHPSFQADLGIGFDLPSNTLLSEAEAEVSLKNIRTLDFNNSNPFLDNTLRSLARRYRKDATARIDFADDIPEINELPFDVFLHHFLISGAKDGGPVLDLKAEIRNRL